MCVKKSLRESQRKLNGNVWVWNPRWFSLYCFYFASLYLNFFLSDFVPLGTIKNERGGKNDSVLLDTLTPKCHAFLICETGMTIPASLGWGRIP